MSTPHTHLDTATAVDRTLVLLGEFLQTQLEDPALLEEVPNGATVALIPDDDPELAEHNLNLALESFAAGKNVYLRHVRQTPAPVATEQ